LLTRAAPSELNDRIRGATVRERSLAKAHLKADETFPRMTLKIGLFPESGARCCGEGVVYVKFRLDRGRVVVSDAKYDPAAEYRW
jgi:hypothetical protein